MPNPEMMGPASLAIGQTVGAFSLFLPKFAEIRRSDGKSDAGMVQDVRMGEVAAMAVCIGIGALVSSLTGSSIPVFVSIFMGVLLFSLYEAALRSDVA